jgi:hypothetical protein
VFGAAVAHGNADGFVSMDHEGRTIWFGPAELARLFGGTAPAPPLILLACNCAEFDRERPSFAERALFLAGGPAAVIGATTESHPLTNFLTGVALLQTLSEGKPRLGDLWLAAERRAFAQKDFLAERLLKDVEGRLEKEIDVAKLRRDQRLLYALLGDPALRLRVPGALQATVAERRWRAERPQGATRLFVGFRPAAAPKAAEEGNEQAKRRARFAAANAAMAFAPVAEMGEGAWEGTADQPGRLRLVATGPGVLAACVLEVK